MRNEKVLVNPWINTKSYYTENIGHFCFIEDTKSRMFYLIKGEIVTLWNEITKSANYTKINDFAIKNNFEEELQAFLYELQNKEIINSNLIFEKNEKNYLKYAISLDKKRFLHINKTVTDVLIKNNFLPSLTFLLNYACNLNCKHCFNPKNQNELNINFETAKKIIDEACELGVNQISLTGGESTINKDFFKIANYIRKKHLRLSIFTNGQLFFENKNLLKKVISLYPYEVIFSIYSLNPETHDQITSSKGSLYKTKYVIEQLRKHNLKVKINCFLTSKNKNDYKEVKEYAKSINAEYIVDCKFIYNEENNNLSYKLEEEDIEAFYKDTLNIESPRNFVKKDDSPICTAGTNNIGVTPNLDITPCIYFNYKLGNYKTDSLKNIYNTEIQNFKKIFIHKNLTECHKESYCKYCSYCSIIGWSKDKCFKKIQILCEDAKAYQKALLFHEENLCSVKKPPEIQ